MEFNYAGMAFKANLDADPDLMAFDGATFEKKLAARRVAEAKANPSKPPVDPYQEYKQLRGTLRQLEQYAANTAIYFTNIAGTLALIETNVKRVEQEKQYAFRAGNNVAVMNWENALPRMRDELADASKELKRAKAEKEHAAKVLAAFDQHARIAELQQYVDSLNPNI
jgi:MFS superfamily sulfate permease-like transporter